MMNKKFVSFCLALSTVALFAACNSNNVSKDKKNKERMMPDTTTDLLEYDSTKTKSGR